MAKPAHALDAQQRYAADAMSAAIHKAVVALGAGKADPDDPYCWDNEAEFDLYGQLRGAMAAAERARFGQGRFFEATCATCLHFRPYQSGRADAPPLDRRFDGDQSQSRAKADEDAAAIGVCTESPPQRAHLPMAKDLHDTSHCPRVHCDWICGRWQATTSRGRL